MEKNVVDFVSFLLLPSRASGSARIVESGNEESPVAEALEATGN